MSGKPWTVWDTGVLPTRDVPEHEQRAIVHWLELLKQGPTHVRSIHLPSVTIASTLQPEDEDYERLPENVHESVIPGTDWHCRFQVNYRARTIHLVRFERGLQF